MPRRLLALTLLLAALLLAPAAPAATLAPDRQIVFDWGRADAQRVERPDAHAPYLLRAAALRLGERPILRIRLFLSDLALLPQRRVVLSLRVARPDPLPPPAPGAPPVILPLPGAMPLLLGALMGFLLVGRRRRRVPGLARTKEAT